MLKHTPFYDVHQQAGAKLVDFAGFEMPVQYQGIKKEHQAVREAAGLFDVSHMGELFVTGPEALKLVHYVTINDASRLTPGDVQYSAMCYHDGGIIDDLLVYRLDEQEFMLVVNASNIQKDFNWIQSNNTCQAELANRSDDLCLLAVQGPESTRILQKLTDIDLSTLKSYTFKHASLAGQQNIIISATGYTGEMGYELYFPKNDHDPVQIWNEIMKAGRAKGLEPCGLGARNTLRLEMGYALYGNDISKETNPIEAGLSWITKPDKSDFIGRDALKTIKEKGAQRSLTGFVMNDKRSIPRTGYTIFSEEEKKIGAVSSGSRSITLNKNIGMGYIAKEFSQEGTTVYIKIRNKMAPAKVEQPPFIRNDS